MSNPFGLTDQQRQYFGEYITRQQAKERLAIPMKELEIVIEVIRLCIPETKENGP